jgi:hypothetical protein
LFVVPLSLTTTNFVSVDHPLDTRSFSAGLSHTFSATAVAPGCHQNVGTLHPMEEFVTPRVFLARDHPHGNLKIVLGDTSPSKRRAILSLPGSNPPLTLGVYAVEHKVSGDLDRGEGMAACLTDPPTNTQP